MKYFALLVVLLVGGAAAAATFDAPKRKSGLWEIQISSGQAKGVHAMQQCIDEKTDDLMKKELGDNQKPQCSKNEMRKEGDKIIADSVCKVDNSMATTRAVFTGRFDSAYKGDIEAKWLGPCKAGQKPGDIVMPGMPNINIDEMRKGATKRP